MLPTMLPATASSDCYRSSRSTHLSYTLPLGPQSFHFGAKRLLLFVENGNAGLDLVLLDLAALKQQSKLLCLLLMVCSIFSDLLCLQRHESRHLRSCSHDLLMDLIKTFEARQ